jgi:hypothetical protein
MSRFSLSRLLTVSALIGVPLLCGALFFMLEAPGRDPGVYVETKDGFYALSADPLKTPALPSGPAVAFFAAGAPDSALMTHAAAATLKVFAVDHGDARFRPEGVTVPATIRQINPRAYRISTEELKKPWGPGSIAFDAYQRALVQTRGSRTTIEMMIGLEIQDTDAGPRRIYAVRVGPAQ